MDGLFLFLEIMRQANMTIRTVYDIGAHKGEWSKAIKAKALPNADFFLFEANPIYEKDLDATGLRHFINVLSNPGRESVDFYNGAHMGDSYYKETTGYYDHQVSTRIDCTTLNELVVKHKLPVPNFMKLDTQGSELDILAGAEPFLEQVDLIYIECPIVRYNAGAPNIQDYLDYFRGRRFLPVAALEAHIGEHILLQIDIMFMREEAKNKYMGPHESIRPWIA